MPRTTAKSSKPAHKPTKAPKAKKTTNKKAQQSQTAAATQPVTAQATSDAKPLTAAPKLFIRACKLLTDHWKPFVGMLLIYMLLSVVLVGGIGDGQLSSTKHNIADLFTGAFGQLSGGLALFTLVLSSSNSSNSSGSVYQMVLLLVISLALIWSLRHLYAGSEQKLRIRDAFYNGMAPLVPFILILAVIGLQALPATIGGFLYGVIITGGIAANTAEKVLCGAGCLLLAVLSLYWICSSVMALYVVAQPGMTPLRALRSARELVKGRRVKVLRKLLFLLVVLVILALVLVVPVLVVATPVATVFFFVLSTVGLAIMHSYIYSLYRELIA